MIKNHGDLNVKFRRGSVTEDNMPIVNKSDIAEYDVHPIVHKCVIQIQRELFT